MADPEVLVQDLEIGYSGNTVLAGCRFELFPGDHLSLVGINGSGKSTLLKTLAGLLPPLGGRLEVLGRNPGKTPGLLAYHAQFHPSAQVLPLRALDVVRMGRFTQRGLWRPLTSEDHRLVGQSMELLGVSDLAQISLGELSGGQRQRVFLAQAFARDAQLYLMDEPTAALDLPGQAYLDQGIQYLRQQKKTLIWATHSLKDAARGSHVLLLARKQVAFGPPKEVLTQENLLATFGLGAQTGLQGLMILNQEHEHDHD